MYNVNSTLRKNDINSREVAITKSNTLYKGKNTFLIINPFHFLSFLHSSVA